ATCVVCRTLNTIYRDKYIDISDIVPVLSDDRKLRTAKVFVKISSRYNRPAVFLANRPTGMMFYK
ncbi:MAG: hypothetical protein ACKVHB_02345, partial [Pseudomonadales bacterium]